MDVQTTFLHGNLHEEIYMERPHGYISKDYPNYLCKLIKSLYGLEQSHVNGILTTRRNLTNHCVVEFRADA